MFCTNCGAKLEDAARFCSTCGKPVVVPAPSKPAVEEPPVAPAAEEIPAAPMAEEAPAEPVIEDIPAEPVAEEAPAEPVTEVLNPAPAEAQLPAADETPVTEEVPTAPAAKGTIAEEKAHKKDPKARPAPAKPHMMLQILMQFLSFLVCLALLASLTATVALADLNRITSKNGIQQLVGALVSPAPQRTTPAAGARGVLLDAPGSTDDDPIENVDDLVSWLYNEIAKASDTPLTVTEEQILALVQEPAISAFIAEKLAGFAEDFINSTQNTAVTTDEIMTVLEENRRLIEEKLDTELNDETMANLKKSVHKLVVEQDLAGTIQGQVFDSVENAIDNSVASTGTTWEDIQPVVQFLCSDAMLCISIAICLVLMMLLCALNFYNIPGGLIWIAVPCILAGGIPAAALALAPLVAQLFPAVPAAAMQILSSFSIPLLPIHGTVLGLGLVLLLVSITWLVIRKAAARKQETATV